MFKKNTKIRESFGDSVLQLFTSLILIAVTIIVAYPILYVISSSFSDSATLNAGRVYVLPMIFNKDIMGYTVGLDFSGYKFVFAYALAGISSPILYLNFYKCPKSIASFHFLNDFEHYKYL
jgi:ABC-type glycerol-3-phosphate transport system permease component